METLRIMRQDLGYRGYIHAKIMPGTDPALIHQAGLYANRLSVNIEVARSEGFAKIARNKTRDNILKPMGQISAQIRRAREEAGRFRPAFATSQTTQLMAGSTGEDDKTILTLSQALYKTYGLSRVYYTAFQYRHPAAGYADLPPVSTPLWRMRRLYQADRLMQVYGFTAEEIAPDDAPNLEEDLDPKAAWALRAPRSVPGRGEHRRLRSPPHHSGDRGCVREPDPQGAEILHRNPRRAAGARGFPEAQRILPHLQGAVPGPGRCG